jgi:hypothetical protein
MVRQDKLLISAVSNGVLSIAGLVAAIFCIYKRALLK